ncbi:MAG TPA: hypothetical protein PKL31_04655 [Fulvivirga sp.]|nr:hypothetical protein [Fulvivirga sp.]
MKQILMSLLIVITLTACQTKLEKENIALKSENAELKKQNEEFKSGSSKLNSSIESYKKTLQEIDNNLASISANQTLVSSLTPELKDKKDVAENIKNRIANIRALMENSRMKILTLDKNLNEIRRLSNAKSDEILSLDKKVKETSQKLIDKQLELTALRESLESQLFDLGVELDEQLMLSEDLRNTLNRAYYIAAEAKELKEKEIVNKEGGFIGLGKVKVLNANASDGLFIKAEKDKLNAIDLNCKKAKLISSHPDGSYEFVGEGSVEKLVIKDADAFWKDTNYLVIETSGQSK